MQMSFYLFESGTQEFETYLFSLLTSLIQRKYVQKKQNVFKRFFRNADPLSGMSHFNDASDGF